MYTLGQSLIVHSYLAHGFIMNNYVLRVWHTKWKHLVAFVFSENLSHPTRVW